MLRNVTSATTNLIRSSIFSPQIIVRSFSAQSDFDQAQQNLKKLTEEPDNDVKLKLYALFKQATVGDVQGKRPGMMDFVGKAKYDAWEKLKGQTKEAAQHAYSTIINGLSAEEASNQNESGAGIEGLAKVNGLEVAREGKIFKITLNRPKKFNAITLEMYKGLQDALNFSNADKTTSITVVTAAGNYFCSGNDLTNFKAAASGNKEQIAQMAKEAKVVLRDYVDAYINHEKPLIGLINGPAVGIAVTVLGLFDYVIATDKATFHTPFAPLGQSPEGASSYTFPTIMGPVRAAELLLICNKISANTAKDYGLVNEIIPDAEFQATSSKLVEKFSKIPPESLRINKTLLRSFHKEKLLEVNKIECDIIEQRWQSKECHQAIAAFLARSAKN